MRERVLLAAGCGTRIRSLWADTPKPLIETGGRPPIEHLPANLAPSGASRVGPGPDQQALP